MHGLGPRLHDVELAGRAVLCPFHIHRHPCLRALGVVLLNESTPASELFYLWLGENEAPLFICRCLYCFGLLDADFPESVEHLLIFHAERFADNGRFHFAYLRFHNEIFVGRHVTLHNELAQAPCGVDKDQIAEAAFSIDGEHHAGSALIGAHHLLYAHRESDLSVRKSFISAIRNRAVGEERCHRPHGRGDDVFATANAEIGLMLAREGRARQVLGGRGGAHSDVDVFAIFLLHLRIGIENGLLEIGGEGRLVHRVAHEFRASREFFQILGIQTSDRFRNECIKPRLC